MRETGSTGTLTCEIACQGYLIKMLTATHSTLAAPSKSTHLNSDIDSNAHFSIYSDILTVGVLQDFFDQGKYHKFGTKHGDQFVALLRELNVFVILFTRNNEIAQAIAQVGVGASCLSLCLSAWFSVYM